MVRSSIIGVQPRALWLRSLLNQSEGVGRRLGDFRRSGHDDDALHLGGDPPYRLQAGFAPPISPPPASVRASISGHSASSMSIAAATTSAVTSADERAPTSTALTAG